MNQHSLGIIQARQASQAVFWLVLLLNMTAPIFAADPIRPQDLFDKGIQLFLDGRPAESAKVFDALVAEVPPAEPELWQRGLALYYAGRFADGRKQFERHRAANPNDVENVTWHFACVARDQGAAAAREQMLPVGEDRRVPMREMLDFYAGRGDAAAVVAAAEAGDAAARRNQLCFAHLYLGLHAEAVGDAELAKRHMLLAAGPFTMDHFMGRVAVLHAKLRGWDIPEARLIAYDIWSSSLGGPEQGRGVEPRNPAMHLTPREIEKLFIHAMAEVALRRKAKGIKLNHPEAMAARSIPSTRRGPAAAMPPTSSKGGMINWANMGDPNASLPTPQPTFYRRMFEALGAAVHATAPPAKTLSLNQLYFFS